MALPRLNTEPKFRINIPSTGKQSRFRPFLVKEEKVLMLAMESKDERLMLDAVADTIVACIEDDIDKSKLTTFDIEYLFTKIRAKSVGEITRVNIKCQNCEHENEVGINIDEVKMTVKQNESMIKLDDGITLEMKWPTLEDIINAPTEMDIKSIFTMLRIAMMAIHTNDERIDLAEYSDKEVEDFIESMNTEQFNKIKEYMEAIPTLKHKVEFDCVSCQTHNELTLEGMQSFF